MQDIPKSYYIGRYLWWCGSIHTARYVGRKTQPNIHLGLSLATPGATAKKDWTLWQLALCQAFPEDNLLCLDQPLRQWLQPPLQAIHHWHWLTSYSSQKLYHWNRQWQIHARHRGHSNCNPKYWVTPSGDTAILPPDCKRVTIKQSATYLMPSFGHGHMETPANVPMTWQEFVNQLPAKHKGIF